MMGERVEMMGDEDVCAAFSVKLEDIHLVSKYNNELKSINTSSQQLVTSESAKNNRNNSASDTSHQNHINYWQHIFDDSLPAISQQDLSLQNLIAEDSVDFGNDFYNFFPQAENQLLTDAKEPKCPPPTPGPSPAGTPHSRSRSVSISINNVEEDNGSDKKRAKFDKNDSAAVVVCMNGHQTHSDAQELILDYTDHGSAHSQSQALTHAQLLQTLLSQAILSPELQDAQHTANSQSSSSLSLSPLMSNSNEKRSGSNNHVVLVSPHMLPDLTEGQPMLDSMLSPPQAFFHCPSTRPHLRHSRSGSTSPERRESIGCDKKEGRLSTECGKEQKEKIPRHKRPSHINAEHRRRFKIQGCIEELNEMLPVQPGGTRTTVGGSKKSNAALLSRAAGYCRQLKAECRESEREADALRTEIEALTADINAFHDVLPTDGVSQTTVAEQVPIEQLFDSYVQTRTLSNWKFYIFSLFVRPFFETYNRVVDASSVDRFYSSLSRWMQDHFTLAAFRTSTTPVFRHISTKTSFMVTPEKLPQEALQAAMTRRLSVPGTSSSITTSTVGMTSTNTTTTSVAVPMRRSILNGAPTAR